MLWKIVAGGNWTRTCAEIAQELPGDTLYQTGLNNVNVELCKKSMPM